MLKFRVDRRIISPSIKQNNLINILVLWPFQLNQKHKTNSGYKHNDKKHFTFDLTFRMLQHASSEVTVEQIQI